MNITFTKAEEIDGDLTITRDDVVGMVQVYWVPMDNGSHKATVSNAGTIMVTRIRNLKSSVTLSAVVEKLEDITLTATRAPAAVKVTGTLKINVGAKSILKPFEGILHTTGYFREAWEAIMQPDWSGGRNF